MYLNIKSLKAENFLSYNKLELEFNDFGINIIEGWNFDGETSNGSGKSSVFDALAFALYGNVPRRIKPIECLKFGEQKSHVELEFTDTTGNEYRILREITPSKLYFWVNNVQVAQENKIALQSHINKLIGIDYPLFHRTIYFPQNWYDRFLVLSEEQRKDILFNIMKLDRFDVIYDKISSDHKESGYNLKVIESKLGTQLDAVTTLVKDYKSYKEKANSFDVEKKNDLMGLDSELQKVSEELNGVVKKLQQVKAVNESRPAFLEECREKLKVAEDRMHKLNELREKKEVVRATINKLCEQNAQAQDELSIITATGKPCPYCYKSLDDDFVKNKTKLVREDMAKRDKEITKYENYCVKIEQTLRDHYDSTNREIAELNQKLGETQPQDAELEALSRAQQALAERDNNLKRARGKRMVETNVYMDLVQEIKEKYEKLKSEIETNEKERDRLIAEVASLSRLKKIFGPHGIKAIVLEGVIDELNAAVRDYLSVLYEQSVDIKFTIQSNTTPSKGVSYKIPVEFTMNGQEWAFNSLSGGEKRRAIIAADFALSKIMTRRYGDGCNLLLLDEVTTDLDEHSRTKFYDLIQHMSHEKAVYLIDHAYDRSTIKNATILKVEKKNGTSTAQTQAPVD